MPPVFIFIQLLTILAFFIYLVPIFSSLLDVFFTPIYLPIFLLRILNILSPFSLPIASRFYLYSTFHNSSILHIFGTHFKLPIGCIFAPIYLPISLLRILNILSPFSLPIASRFYLYSTSHNSSILHIFGTHFQLPIGCIFTPIYLPISLLRILNILSPFSLPIASRFYLYSTSHNSSILHIFGTHFQLPIGCIFAPIYLPISLLRILNILSPFSLPIASRFYLYSTSHNSSILHIFGTHFQLPIGCIFTPIYLPISLLRILNILSPFSLPIASRFYLYSTSHNSSILHIFGTHFQLPIGCIFTPIYLPISLLRILSILSPFSLPIASRFYLYSTSHNSSSLHIFGTNFQLAIGCIFAPHYSPISL